MTKRTYRYVIRKRSKNIGAFVPIEDLELLESLEDTLDAKEIDKIIAKEEFIDLEDAKKNWNDKWNIVLKL